jgi:hypothetical protein
MVVARRYLKIFITTAALANSVETHSQRNKKRK